MTLDILDNTRVRIRMHIRELGELHSSRFDTTIGVAYITQAKLLTLYHRTERDQD